MVVVRLVVRVLIACCVVALCSSLSPRAPRVSFRGWLPVAATAAEVKRARTTPPLAEAEPTRRDHDDTQTIRRTAAPPRFDDRTTPLGTRAFSPAGALTRGTAMSAAQPPRSNGRAAANTANVADPAPSSIDQLAAIAAAEPHPPPRGAPHTTPQTEPDDEEEGEEEEEPADAEPEEDDDEAYEDDGAEEYEAMEESKSKSKNNSAAAQRKRKRGTSSASSHNSSHHNEDETGAANASRTARACSWCRRRKRKCDGAKPTCCWCAKGNLACNYPSALLKRGPQSGMMKKLKKKVEELEQQLSTVRVLPRSMVGGMDAPATLSITSFLQRIRGAKAFHLAASASMMGASLSHAQLHALTPTTPATHAALRDRLYLASFLSSFNLVFPVLGSSWESTYLMVLHDETGNTSPPLHWTFQYASAIAMGALMHQDVAYANESASVARHAASALFDEAHAEVLRGLLLLSCLLIGLGQRSRASCYIAVASRMIYLLSRPPCVDVRVANSSHEVTSELAFPGTFPAASVPLTLQPVPASESSAVSIELKLLYSLVEDLSSAMGTVHGMTQIGWDRVEQVILAKKKRQLQAGEANATSATAAANAAAAASVALTSIPPPIHPPYYSLSNDHLLTLGLEVRHSTPNVLSDSLVLVESWKPVPSVCVDLSVGTTALLRLFVFLSSFRGDFMQLVKPQTELNGTPLQSTAVSMSSFESSLANTKVALSICNKLVDVLPAVGANSSSSSTRAMKANAASQQPKLHLLLLTQPSNAQGVQHQPPVLLLQSAESQLHALALLFKAIFMHMLLMEQDSNPDTIATPEDGKRTIAETEQGNHARITRTTGNTTPPSAVASHGPKLQWSAVILGSNTATSYIDSHGLDLSYCAFFSLLLHLNVQIKLKYFKQCMASWKRSQKWQMQHMITQGSPPATNREIKTATTTQQTATTPDATDGTPPPGVLTLSAATHTLLDSLHYLHIDFSLVESLNQRWSTFSGPIWKDAQERVTELLHYLQLPVGTMNGASQTNTGTTTATSGSGGAGREAAVLSVLLEDALGVYDSIMSKYPLFNANPASKKGHSHTTPVAAVPATAAAPASAQKQTGTRASKRSDGSGTAPSPAPSVPVAVACPVPPMAPYPAASSAPFATAAPLPTLPPLSTHPSMFSAYAPASVPQQMQGMYAPMQSSAYVQPMQGPMLYPSQLTPFQMHQLQMQQQQAALMQQQMQYQQQTMQPQYYSAAPASPPQQLPGSQQQQSPQSAPRLTPNQLAGLASLKPSQQLAVVGSAWTAHASKRKSVDEDGGAGGDASANSYPLPTLTQMPQYGYPPQQSQFYGYQPPHPALMHQQMANNQAQQQQLMAQMQQQQHMQTQQLQQQQPAQPHDQPAQPQPLAHQHQAPSSSHPFPPPVSVSSDASSFKKVKLMQTPSP